MIDFHEGVPPNVRIVPPNSCTHALDCKDRCDETSLPSPEIQPEDRCRNERGSARWLSVCQFESTPELVKGELPHHQKENGKTNHIIVCNEYRKTALNRLPGLTFGAKPGQERTKSHRQRGFDGKLGIPDYIPSRGSAWRYWIRYAWTDVCRSCDVSQRSRHRDGFDGCRCHKENVAKGWLYHKCDEIVLQKLMNEAWSVRNRRSSQMFYAGAAIRDRKTKRGRVRCLCGNSMVMSST